MTWGWLFAFAGMTWGWLFAFAGITPFLITRIKRKRAWEGCFFCFVNFVVISLFSGDAMDIGGPELIVIFFVILILFGPRRIPEIARLLAKITREIRKAVDEIKRELSDHDDPEG